MEAKKLVPVSTDFNVAVLRKAAREGRLFILPPLPKEEILNNIKEASLDYISKVREFVSQEYQPYIQSMWRDIFASKCVEPFIAFSQTCKSDQMNKYFIFNILLQLRDLKVYKPVCDAWLAKTIEGIPIQTRKKLPVQTCHTHSEYRLKGIHINIIREIVSKYKVQQ